MRGVSFPGPSQTVPREVGEQQEDLQEDGLGPLLGSLEAPPAPEPQLPEGGLVRKGSSCKLTLCPQGDRVSLYSLEHPLAGIIPALQLRKRL